MLIKLCFSLSLIQCKEKKRKWDSITVWRIFGVPGEQCVFMYANWYLVCLHITALQVGLKTSVLKRSKNPKNSNFQFLVALQAMLLTLGPEIPCYDSHIFSSCCILQLILMSLDTTIFKVYVEDDILHSLANVGFSGIFWNHKLFRKLISRVYFSI